MTEIKPLFAIRTNIGYGLFQEYNSYRYYKPFYIIYRVQVQELFESKILEALQCEYYYQRYSFKDCICGFDEVKIRQSKGREFKPSDFGIANEKAYNNSYITYLGDYPLPQDAEIPKYSRYLELSCFTGKHYWTLYDELMGKSIQEKDKVKIYKKVTPEILPYPNFHGISPNTLVERFNENFHPNDYDDEWVEKFFEKYYQENPQMRPCKEKYEDVKYPLPTENWRKFEDIDDEYIAFCDKVESAIKAFIAAIDENKKAVSKPLTVLLTELNKINSEVYGIDTLEAEELYDYIAKILRALKKPQMIDNIENMREW
jgi:hypothetical protein